MSPSDFKTQFPEFAEEQDARVQLFIDRAAPHFDTDRWGDLYADGMANYIAHQIKSANDAGASGGAAKSGLVQSKSVGDVRVSYAATEQIAATDIAFASTAYGQNYLRLRRLVGNGALSV